VLLFGLRNRRVVGKVVGKLSEIALVTLVGIGSVRT